MYYDCLSELFLDPTTRHWPTCEFTKDTCVLTFILLSGFAMHGRRHLAVEWIKEILYSVKKTIAAFWHVLNNKVVQKTNKKLRSAVFVRTYFKNFLRILLSNFFCYDLGFIQWYIIPHVEMRICIHEPHMSRPKATKPKKISIIPVIILHGFMNEKLITQSIAIIIDYW